jgi:hypothetical protein
VGSPRPLLPDMDSGAFKVSLGSSPLDSPRPCLIEGDMLLGQSPSILETPGGAETPAGLAAPPAHDDAGPILPMPVDVPMPSDAVMGEAAAEQPSAV